jgi:hypothetical protein
MTDPQILKAAGLAFQTQVAEDPGATTVGSDIILPIMSDLGLSHDLEGAVDQEAERLWAAHLRRRTKALELLQARYQSANAAYAGDEQSGFFARRDRAALEAVTDALSLLADTGLAEQVDQATKTAFMEGGSYVLSTPGVDYCDRYNAWEVSQGRSDAKAAIAQFDNPASPPQPTPASELCAVIGYALRTYVTDQPEDRWTIPAVQFVQNRSDEMARVILDAIASRTAPALFTADELGAVRDALTQWCEECGTEDTAAQALLDGVMAKLQRHTDPTTQENR